MFAPKGNDGRTAQQMSGRGGRSYGIDVIQLGTLTDLSVFGSLPSARRGRHRLALLGPIYASLPSLFNLWLRC